MKRSLVLLYGVFSYFTFLLTFIYFAGFLANMGVPKSVDSGPPTGLAYALLINTGLIGLFAIQHTIMARPWFKKWWNRFLPNYLERSTFVLIAGSILLMIFAFWKPIPTIVWNVENPLGRALAYGFFLLGWVLVVHSSFLINHFDLFGLRQVYLFYRNRAYSPVPFKGHSLYKRVRHPMMLGFIITLWATPTMTVGHLLFSLELTLYIFMGLKFEERDLMRHYGRDYLEYRKKTSMVIPSFRKDKTSSGAG